MIRRLICLAVLALLPQGAMAQSWCNSADLNPTEAAICRDSVLPGLDARLNTLYRQVETPAVAASQRDWLARRNACRSDIFCIEGAYLDRLAELRQLADTPTNPGPRRPWCTSGGLNPTERTICGSDRLANLDAAMGAIYGSLRADGGDRSQINWLRGDRDACGMDRACIAGAYVRRIVELGRLIRRAG